MEGGTKDSFREERFPLQDLLEQLQKNFIFADNEEEKEKNKLCVLAKKELEEWYKSRKEELEKRKKNNRCV